MDIKPILVSKTSIKLLTLPLISKETGDEKKKTFTENVITFLKTALYNLSWLPLILSSLIYKIGVIVLYVEFLGSFWWAFLMLAFIFVGNFLTCFILKYVPVPSPAKYNIYIINSSDDNKEEEDIKVYQDLPFREKIFISYSNLFIISGPIKEVKYKNEISQVINDHYFFPFRTSLNSAILLQPFQHIVNLIFMLIFIIKALIADNYSKNDVWLTFGFSVIVFIMSIFNLALCFIIWKKRNKWKITPPQEEVEMKRRNVKGKSFKDL